MRELVSAPDGIPIAYEVYGEGVPSLVFVHGWSCDRTYWRHQMEHFAPRNLVVGIDLAGHGESGVGRAGWTMPAFGEDVVAVAERLDLDRMVLIGHSMGGDVVVEAGLRAAERTIGLVWVDTYTDLDEPREPSEIERFIAPFRQDFVPRTRAFVRSMFPSDADPDLVGWVAADMSASPPEIALDAMAHAIGNDRAMPALLRRLTAPIVSIAPGPGSADADDLERHGVRTVHMPAVGHFPMLEDPPAFNRVLGAVVDDLVR